VSERCVRLKYLTTRASGDAVAETVGEFISLDSVESWTGKRLSVAEAYRDFSGTPCRQGDILFGKLRPYLAKVHFVGTDAVCASEFIAMRPTKEAEPRFLRYVLSTGGFVRLVNSMSYGTKMPRVDPADFLDIKIAVPNPAKQSRIADYLDSETARIDTLIDRKQRFIDLLLEKRTALITHAVTKGLDPHVEMKDSGIDFIGEVPAHWQVAPLYARYEVTLGKMLDAKQITGEHLAPYLRNADVQWDYVNTGDLDQMDFDASARLKFRLRVGDLLVCEGGEVGRTAMWRGELEECYYQKAVHRLRPWSSVRDVPRFFYYTMLASAMGERFTVGSNVATIGHLTAAQLRHHRFAFPSSPEQATIVDFLDSETDKLDVIVERTRQSIDLLREYRTALISAAVTGLIDIPEGNDTEDVA